MAINTTAIQETIDQLKQRVQKDTTLISLLEDLLPQLIDAPAPVAAAKNGGGKRVKTTHAEAAPTSNARGFPKAKQCDDCGTMYTATGARSLCPKCHPKTVTGREWAERERSEKPRGVDRSA